MSRYIPAFITAVALLTPVAVFAAPYVPLEPLPFVPTNAGSNLPAVLQGLFQLLVIGGAGIAVLMITIGGVQYMTGDSLHQKSEGRERIQGAVLGLLLLFGIYIILRAINPDLLNFDLRSITRVGEESKKKAQALGASSGSNPGSAATPGLGGGQNIPLTIDMDKAPRYQSEFSFQGTKATPRIYTSLERCREDAQTIKQDGRLEVVVECQQIKL